MKQTVKIMLLCMAMAVLYGIVHNQVTVRISLEYFTIGHREIISSTSPTLLGIAWGIHPNWWVGLSLGILLAIASRAGKWPKRDVHSLIKPLLIVFLITGIAAAAAGIMGYRMALNGDLGLNEPMYSAVSESGHASFISALWMHTASYTVAAMAGLIFTLLVFTGRMRVKGKETCKKLP